MPIRKTLVSELTWVNTQYHSIGFVPSSESDFIAIAEIDGVKVGLGRIVHIEDKVGELGGMFVLPEFRGHEIATSIVQFLLENSPCSTLFSIPFAHLSTFYQRFGFSPTEPAGTIPVVIAEKLAWCKKTYDAPVTLLCRHGQ